MGITYIRIDLFFLSRLGYTQEVEDNIYTRSKELNLEQQIMRLLCYLYTTSQIGGLDGDYDNESADELVLPSSAAAGVVARSINVFSIIPTTGTTTTNQPK